MTAQDLKNSILQQAIQGKLTRQLSTDGDAKDLLEKIREEKLKLIAEGKIKKEKPLPPIKAEEIPFDIPDNWTWVRLGEIAFVTKLAGFEYTNVIYPNLSTNGVPLLKGKNVQAGHLILKFESFIPKEISNSLPRSQLNKKCLLTPYVGSIGNIALFDGNIQAHLGSNVGKIEFFNEKNKNISEEYVLQYLLSATGKHQLAKHKKATAQESISIQALRDSLIPLPPLAEQKRIVKKLEEILPLIEKYGELEQRLTKLDKEFPDKLKKSLLQQAIQGKLTRQLSIDGDAKDLLEKIHAEKLKLIAEGKIKKEKPLPPIKAEEIPFDIPENWQWVRFGEIINLISGQDLSLDCHNTEGKGVPYITGASNIIDEEIIINRWTTSPTTTAKHGDLLLSCKGTVGKIAFLKESSAHIARQIMAIKIESLIDKFYIKFFIEKNVQNLKRGMRTKSWTPKGVSYVYERRKGKSPQTL